MYLGKEQVVSVEKKWAWHGAPFLFAAVHLPGSPVPSPCPFNPCIFATIYLACWELQ